MILQICMTGYSVNDEIMRPVEYLSWDDCMFAAEKCYRLVWCVLNFKKPRQTLISFMAMDCISSNIVVNA